MSESYSYPQEAYTRILKYLQQKFKIDTYSLPGHVWIAWRKSIKKLFEQNFTVDEVLGAVEEACNKKLWPSNTAFWHRVEDVCLKNRHEVRPTIRRDGLEGIRGVLDRVLQR